MTEATMTLPRDVSDSLLEIGERVASAPVIGLFLDFDGTVAPIVLSPADAQMDPAIASLLHGLLQRSDFVVGVVSGRALDDLRSRTGLPGLAYVGNHGLETEVGGVYRLHPEAEALRPELRRFSLQLALTLADTQGIEIEDKAVTLSVHFRRVEPELQGWVTEKVLEAAARWPEFTARQGKKVVEIRPRLDVNKGTALRQLCDELLPPSALPIYIGDDLTDEDAFAAIPEGISIKVGEPEETRAQYVLPDVPDVERFLAWLRQTKPHGSTR